LAPNRIAPKRHHGQRGEDQDAVIAALLDILVIGFKPGKGIVLIGQGELFTGFIGFALRQIAVIFSARKAHDYNSSTASTPKRASPLRITCPICVPRKSLAAVSSGILCHDDALFRIVITQVPEGMECRRQIIEIEGDPVRLARAGGGFHFARELRRLLDQRELVRPAGRAASDGT
jgi:hypothetical protein